MLLKFAMMGCYLPEAEKVCHNEKTHDNKYVRRSTEYTLDMTLQGQKSLVYMHFSKGWLDCTTGHEKV